MAGGQKKKLSAGVSAPSPSITEGDLVFLARQVLRLIQEQAAQPGRTERSEESLAALARLLYQGRVNRQRYFSHGLFGEPAWDMLLDLYINRVLGRSVSTSSLSLASHVPQTTALRWVRELCDRGLARRRAHPTDARVTLIELTPHGHKAMRACLTEVAGAMAL